MHNQIDWSETYVLNSANTVVLSSVLKTSFTPLFFLKIWMP